MPVSTTHRKKYYTCNGATTVFAFDFPITDESDLVVQVRTNATGAVSTLTLTTDYTVTKASTTWDNGGNVTTVATYAAGKTLIAFRLTTQDQDMDLEYGDKLDSQSLENSVDKLTMIVQELQEQIDRCVKMPLSDAEALDMEMPNSVDRASKWLGFDASGQPTGVQTTPSSVTVTPYMETVLDDADAATARTTLDVIQDTDDVITTNHIGDEAISVNHLKGDASYKFAKTRYYAVPLVAGGDTYGDAAFASAYIQFTGNELLKFPVNLPHGATVTELMSQAQGASGGNGEMTFALYRSSLTNTDLLQMALTTHTMNTSSNRTDSTINVATIDNSAYDYYLRINMTDYVAGTTYAYGARVKYTVDTPLP